MGNVYVCIFNASANSTLPITAAGFAISMYYVGYQSLAESSSKLFINKANKHSVFFAGLGLCSCDHNSTAARSRRERSNTKKR